MRKRNKHFFHIPLIAVGPLSYKPEWLLATFKAYRAKDHGQRA